MDTSKSWYTSKTLWMNAIGIVAIVVEGVTGKQFLDPGVQVIILGVANMILRLVTKTEVVW